MSRSGLTNLVPPPPRDEDDERYDREFQADPFDGYSASDLDDMADHAAAVWENRLP